MSFFAVSFPLNRKMRHVFRAPLLFIVVTFLTLIALHVNILLMYDVFLNDVTVDGSEVYSFQYTQLYIRYRLVFVYWALTLRCFVLRHAGSATRGQCIGGYLPSFSQSAAIAEVTEH